MHEGGRIIAIGSAYVEGKIQSSTAHLPKVSSDLPVFLDTHPIL